MIVKDIILKTIYEKYISDIEEQVLHDINNKKMMVADKHINESNPQDQKSLKNDFRKLDDLRINVIKNGLINIEAEDFMIVEPFYDSKIKRMISEKISELFQSK